MWNFGCEAPILYYEMCPIDTRDCCAWKEFGWGWYCEHNGMGIYLHLDGGHVEVLNGHVDFEELWGQVNAKRTIHCALHQGDLKEVEKVMRNVLPMS
jgi:hypothetical protein